MTSPSKLRWLPILQRFFAQSEAILEYIGLSKTFLERVNCFFFDTGKKCLILAFLASWIGNQDARAEEPGWFASAGIGVTYAVNNSVDGAIFDYDMGIPSASLTLGYRFGNDLEIHFEGAFNSNDLEILVIEGTEVESGTNDRVATKSLMGTLVYRFDLGHPLRPHLGIGVGLARVHYRTSSAKSSIEFLNDNATTKAVQAIAGFAIELTPKLGFTVNYQFWRAPSIILNKPSGEDVKADFSKYGLILGASYALASRPNSLLRPSHHGRQKGLYTSVRVGTSFAHDANIHRSTTNFDAFDIGSATSIGAGYASNNLRFELEAISFNNPADIIDFGSSSIQGEVRAHGKVTATGVMANMLYDFNLGSYDGSTVRPFAGLGIGYSLYDYRINAGATEFVNDNDGALSLQGIIGISVGLTTSTTFTFDYRYWGAPKVMLTGTSGYDIDTYHSVHGVMLGLRYSLD